MNPLKKALTVTSKQLFSYPIIKKLLYKYSATISVKLNFMPRDYANFKWKI